MNCNSSTRVDYTFTKKELKEILVNQLGLDIPVDSFNFYISDPTYTTFGGVVIDRIAATLTLSESVNG